MTGLENAILGLAAALDSPRRTTTWRWLVRQRMSAVQDALGLEVSRAHDAWLVARERHLEHERAQLLRQLAAVEDTLEHGDDAVVRRQLQRLVQDLERHRRRLNDLVYDTVSLEIGGSE